MMSFILNSIENNMMSCIKNGRRPGRLLKSGYMIFWIAAVLFVMPFFRLMAFSDELKPGVEIEKNDIKEVLTIEEEPSGEASDVQIDMGLYGDGPSFHDKPGVGLKLSYGYHNIAKSGRFLPVSIEVDNYMGMDIRGRVVLEIPKSSDTVMRYSYPVEVKDGRAVDVRGTISISDNVNNIRLRLEDEEGLVLAETNSSIKVQGKGAELLIGILSNRPEKLSYFRGVSIANSELKTRTVSLTPGDIPANEEGLDQLDVIVISDFNIGRLSDEVVDAIWGWVKNGGSLMFGTGNNINCLGAFEEKLKEIEIGDVRAEDVNMGIKYSTDGPDGAVIKLPVRDIYLPEGIQTMQSGDLTVLTTLAVDSGVVGITAYSLCDISDFCAEQLGYTDELLQGLMGSARIKRFTNVNTDGNGSYRAAEKLINQVDPDRLPMVFFYFIVSMSYVLLIGPGLYFFMKYRGISTYYSIAAIFAASCAALVIWLLSASVRFDGPFVNYAVIREINEDNIDESRFINVSAPAKTNLSFELPLDCMVQPVMQTLDKKGDSIDEAFSEVESYISIIQEEDKKLVMAENMKPFSKNYFEIYKKSPNTTGMPLDISLSFFDEQLKGSVKNITEQDLEDVTLLLYGRLLYIGDIAAGEEKNINGESLLYGPTGSMELTARYITGLDAAYEGSREYLKALSKTRVLAYYMQESLSSYYPGARVIAYSEDSGIENSNKSIQESYGTTLIVASADINQKSGGESYRSVLSSEPKVISGEYQADSNTTSGSAAVVLEYSLGTDLDITSLRFHNLSAEFSGKEEADGVRLLAFQGAKAIYNYSTSTYDLIDSGKLYFTAEELIPYMSPANTVTVRYIPDENAEAGAKLFLPVPTVTGVEK